MSDAENVDLAAEESKQAQAKKIVDFFTKLSPDDLKRTEWPELTEDLLSLYDAVDKKIDELFLIHDKLHEAIYEHLEEDEEKQVGNYKVHVKDGVIDLIYKL